MKTPELASCDRAAREMDRRDFRFVVHQALCWIVVVAPLLGVSPWPGGGFVRPAQACKPTENTNDNETPRECKTCTSLDCPSCQPNPACALMSSNPILLDRGAVVEQVTDLSLPGTVFPWSHQRNYDSLLVQADGDEAAAPNGYRWKSDSLGEFLTEADGDLKLFMNGPSMQAWPSNGMGGQAPPPAQPTSTLVHSGYDEDAILTLTDLDTGEIRIFHGFDNAIPEHNKGRLKEQTTRQLKAQGLSGVRFTYDGSIGYLTQVMTAEPQSWTINYTYYDTGSEVTRLQKIEVKNGSNVLVQKAEYLYYGNVTSPSSDLGQDGDLVQVKISRLASDGTNWNVKLTQYRYYTGTADGEDHQLKMVIEADAIERIITAGNTNIDTTTELLTRADSYTVAGGKSVADYSSRSFTYYTSDLNTTGNITTIWGTENLSTKYGGSNLSEYDSEAFGRVKTERVNGSCLSCGGGSGASGLTHTYYYMDLNGGADSDPDVVVRLVVEDTQDSLSTPLYRKIWGSNTKMTSLREAFLADPTASPITAWCNSKIIDAQYRVTQSRSPSAHSLIDSNTELAKFFNPTVSTNDADTLNSGSGLIEVGEFDADGRQTGRLVKQGSSGTAYYLAATDYGNGSSARADQVVAEYVYPTQTTTRSNGEYSSIAYTYWDGSKQQVKKETHTGLDLSSQNGPDTQAVTDKYYDKLGRLRWTEDALGHVNYYSYHPDTGGLAYTAIDVDPSSMPGSATGNNAKWVAATQDGDGNGTYDSSGIPTRSASHTALALVSTTEFDSLGRTVKRTDPDGSLHYTVYEANRTIRFPYWTGSASLMPIQVTVMCDCGQVNETYSVVGNYGSIAITSTVPTGFSSQPGQNDYVSWTRYTYDALTNKLGAVDTYHNIPSSGFGTLSTNFYRTMYRYDDRGRRTHVIQTVSGTSNSTGVEQVTQTVYDVRDRVIETKMGVSNASHDMGSGYTTFPTLRSLSKLVYDGGGVGDSHLTKTLKYHGTGANDYTGVILHPTYRGHNRGMEPIYYSGSETAAGPFTIIDIDWRGLPVATGQYISNPTWATVLTGDGYTAYAGSTTTNRRALSESLYDDAGQLYRSLSYSIGTSDGSKGNYLVNDTFRDLLGRTVASGDLLGGVGQEMAYDGAGRMYQSRVVTQLESSKFSSGAFQYRAPLPHPTFGSMSGGDDLVISLSHSIFDSANNVIGQHELDMVHDDGTLGMDLSNHDDYIRSTVYSYYDAASRLTASANYGSGDSAGGAGEWKYASVPTRAGSAPSAGNTVLVTGYAFEATTGRQYSVTSPGGRVSRSWYDDLGRATWVAENYHNFDPTNLTTISDGGDSSRDRVAAMQYDGLSNQTKLIAYNGSSSDDQNTVYLFEDSVSAKRVTNTIYPDSSDTDSSGTDQIEIVYNVDGSLISRTDQRGTVIAFAYDNLRRLKSQKVTNLGGATNGNIRSITKGYDSLGRNVKITSHNDQTDDPDDVSDVENQVVYTYDGAGNIIKSEQSHDGVVSSSPSVQYTYDGSASSSKFVDGNRLESITYPSGRVLFTDYGSSDSLTDRLGTAFRLRETNSAGTILAEYSRMGSGQIVITDYPQPDLKQDLYQGSSQVYAALDRFGRTKDHRWYKYTSGTVDISRYAHSYDYDGNRLTTEDSVAAAASLNNDELYSFDGLNRLTGFDRGNLSMGSIASKNFSQDYGLDQLNNWSSFGEDTDGNGTDDLTQARTHNDANEIATIASSSTHVAHDAAGNMTKAPVSGNWSAHHDLTWDAWNRLVKVQLSSNTVAEYEYDGLNRRIQKKIYTAGSFDHDEHIYLSEQNQVLEVRIDSDADPKNQFTWGDRYVDDLILRTRDTDLSGSIDESLYAIQDAGWDVTAITDASGTAQERYRYDPYGKSTAIDDDFSSDNDGLSDVDWEYRFTSREFDYESTLHYFRSRYYHDDLGHFSSRDPIGYADGDSLYAAYFAPSGVDPSGLQLRITPRIGPRTGSGTTPKTGQVPNTFPRIYEPPPTEPFRPSGSPYPGPGYGPDPQFGPNEPRPIGPQPGPRPEPTNPQWNCPETDSDCTRDQLNMFNAWVNNSCKNPPPPAPSTFSKMAVRFMSCEEIKQIGDANRRCAQARRNREFTCFRGGNSGHKQQLETFDFQVEMANYWMRWKSCPGHTYSNGPLFLPGQEPI